MGCCASKQANEEARRTKEHPQQPPASMSDTYTNNAHPSCSFDNESIDLAGALAFLRSNTLDTLGEDIKKKSFGEHQGSESRVSLTAVSSSSRFKFKAWCAAAGFDITSVTNQHTHQRAELF